MRPIRCLACKSRWVDVELLFCPPCTKASGQHVVDQIARQYQQFRAVVPNRFSDSNRFLKAMRAAAMSAGFEPVYGPAAVKIVGQRSEYVDGPVAAFHLVRAGLDGIAFNDDTEVRSIDVAIIEGGNMITVVEVRAMLGDELAGVGGAGR